MEFTLSFFKGNDLEGFKDLVGKIQSLKIEKHK